MSGQEKLWRLNQKIRNTKAYDAGVTRCIQAIKVVLSVEKGPHSAGAQRTRRCASAGMSHPHKHRGDSE